MKQRIAKGLGTRANRWVGFSSAVLVVLLATPFKGIGQNVCIKEVSTAPAIDGVVATGLPSPGCSPDAVWGGVSPGEFQPGASLPQGHLYLAFHPGTSTLAIGITVHGDEDLSGQDYVSLFFDTDNSNSWNDGDFVVRVQVGAPASKIQSGVACNVPTGNITYFERSGGAWMETAPPAVVQARVAYDFDSGTDPDDKLWNLELALSVGPSAFDLQTAAPFFGIGGYLFVDDGAQPAPPIGTVRKWPGSITATPSFGVDPDPGFGEPNPGELANASLAGTCFDVNFDAAVPWKINNVAAQAFEEHIDRNAVNTFTVTFFFDGPGDNVASMPNVGTVRLRLRPYGTIPTGTEFDWVKDLEVTVNSMNSERSVTFEFDFANAPANWSDFGTINFICATMFLEAFERDDDDTNNSKNVNHNEFTTSRYAQSIFLSADGVPDLGPGERTTLLLRATMNNEAPGSSGLRVGELTPLPGDRFGGSGMLLAGLVATLIFLVALRYGRSRHVVWAASSVLVLGVSTCHVIQQQERGWSFSNAADLGLQPVADQPGWYILPIREGEIRRLEVEFEDVRLPYETRTMRLQAGEDGQQGMLRIPVESGQVIGLFTSGAVDPDGPNGRLAPTSANGFVQAPTRQRFLLGDGPYRASEHVGALIGSFDGFETAFPVGRGATFVVPEQASTLTLAANVPLDLLDRATGAFDIAVVQRPPLQVPTFPTVGGDGTFAAPLRVNAWDVLTSLNVYTFYETTLVDDDGGVISRTRHPLGFTHQTIFDTHIGEETGPRED